jgi:lipopolysaccharide export system protein LptA
MYRSNNKLPLATILMPILLLLFPTASFAERADRSQPMHLEADQVTMDDAKQISTFTGNVRLSQGTLLILGDKVVVSQDKDGYQHAIAYGNTAEFRQKREGLDEYVEGHGERIAYDARTEVINFDGKAHLKRNRDEVRGDHITYNTKTEIFKVNGSDANPEKGSAGRVHVILQPKSKTDAINPNRPAALPVVPNTITPRKEHE